jgi:hypothetical protein
MNSKRTALYQRKVISKKRRARQDKYNEAAILKALEQSALMLIGGAK